MANSKIIVVEGAQGAGKTTITDYIRNTLKHTNLYRLSGVSDSTITGLEKSTKMYYDLLEYIEKMENLSINLLFDRTFFSEENYCRLGKKDYSFTEVYNDLVEKFSKLDFDIYYITLYLEDESLYETRLKREGKVEPAYAKFSAENSIKQQYQYLKMASEIQEKFPNIKVYNIENSKELSLTEKGRAVALKIMDLNNEWENQIYSTCNTDEKQIVELMRKITISSINIQKNTQKEEKNG